MAFWRPRYNLRWSRTSVKHIGSCGFTYNQGQQGGSSACRAEVRELVPLDYEATVDLNARVERSGNIAGLEAQGRSWGILRGYGGWSDPRDMMLCLHFAELYHK